MLINLFKKLNIKVLLGFNSSLLVEWLLQYFTSHFNKWKNLYQTSLKMVYFIQLELKMFQKFYQIFTYQKEILKNKEEGMELEKGGN